MANIFFNGEKDSKKDAIASVIEHIENYCSAKIGAKVVSDDGGKILQVAVEVMEPSVPLLEQNGDFPLADIIPKWRGWRAVVLKVPVGYISLIMDNNSD
tara:strand:- start:811 stop:1107 length:297 start_codon:yes stop_codon:yes gene_type:complete